MEAGDGFSVRTVVFAGGAGIPESVETLAVGTA